MRLPRGGGILLHPTSLPGRFGIGDLGPEADAFIDFLGDTGQRWWQILPIGPTGYGNSPYQSHSSFAGNPLLISPELLADDGLLDPDDLAGYPTFGVERVDYDGVLDAKLALLRRAFAAFGRGDAACQAFERESADWLDNYALYMAIKGAHGGKMWNDWEPDIAARRPEALRAWAAKVEGEVRFQKFVQFLFDRQWKRLQARCVGRGIGLIGDLPIFVSQDSSDVWASPELFELDERGRPTAMAGVPPDFFSADGQLWGNPLYHWESHKAEGYAWWAARLKASTNRVNLVRLDHFRGFEAYWAVPAGSPTAATGAWRKGPGADFLNGIRKRLGGLPLVAEDLGEITPEVEALLTDFGLPGMKVLQFAFGNDALADQYLPFSYPNHCFVYTGTHDNDTTIGWFTSTNVQSTQPPEEVARERAFVRRYVGPPEEIHWGMIRLAYGSVADTAIVPMQDILGLGSEARMNVPGHASGNWGWRFTREQLTPLIRERLADITAVYGRWSGEVPDPYKTRRKSPAKAAAPPPEADGRSAPTEKRSHATTGAKHARRKPDRAG